MSRPDNPGVRETEDAILQLWDAGHGSASIASRLDQRERYVLDVISRFASFDGWQDQARAGTIALAKAIAATGGCFA